MNKLKLVLIVLVSTFASTELYAQVPTKHEKASVRSQISTEMAKVLVSKDVVPDDEDDKIECDGSGWITHGDGHKTKCEGCKNCGKGETSLASPLFTKAEHEFNVYHFGAKWCSPCNKMKATTWKDESLKKFLEENKCKLFLLDEGNRDHKKFFRYYNIKSYPTMIVLDRDKLSQPLSRVSGFLPASNVTSIVREAIKTDE